MNLATIKTILLDGDGVLWHGDNPSPGLNHFFEQLANRGIRWGLLTNNATRSASYLIEKFQGFGITAGVESMFTSAAATARYVAEHCEPGGLVYVVGEIGLQQALQESDFVVDASLDETVNPVAVVVGLDRSFTYGKLKKAMRLIERGVTYIATNPDTSFPGPHGLSPGAGSIVAAVTTASGVEPVVIGKPGAPLFDFAMQSLGAVPETTAMVGDRLDTDIIGAKQVGLGSILVLSGVAKREDIERFGVQPDLVFDDINVLADEFQKLAI